MFYFSIPTLLASNNYKWLIINSSITITLFFLSLSNCYSASLDFKGYATVRATQADNTEKIPYYRDYADDKVNFTENSNVGLQLYSKIKDDLDFRMTLSMEGKNNYSAIAEWAYISYRMNDNMTFRLGRINAPFYMLTDYINIGYNYPWVSAPQEVYSTNPITAVDGIDFIYQSKGGVDFLFEVYAGSQQNRTTIAPNFVDSPANVNNITSGTKIEFFTNNMIGFNMKLGGDELSMRVGYFQTKVNVPDFNLTSANGNFSAIGLHLDKYNIVIYSELVKRDTDKTIESAFPDQDAHYFTIGYRVKDLLLYTSNAELKKGTDKSIYAVQQTSVSYGFRYEINSQTDFKFEVKTITPNVQDNDIGRYGLFDAPISKESKVYGVTLDFLF